MRRRRAVERLLRRFKYKIKCNAGEAGDKPSPQVFSPASPAPPPPTFPSPNRPALREKCPDAKWPPRCSNGRQSSGFTAFSWGSGRLGEVGRGWWGCGGGGGNRLGPYAVLPSAPALHLILYFIAAPKRRSQRVCTSALKRESDAIVAFQDSPASWPQSTGSTAATTSLGNRGIASPENSGIMQRTDTFPHFSIARGFVSSAMFCVSAG